MLSWAPFIGDPITVIAGIFKVPLKTFLVLVALAKTSRYILIVIFVQKFTLGLQTGATMCNDFAKFNVLGYLLGHYKTCLHI